MRSPATESTVRQRRPLQLVPRFNAGKIPERWAITVLKDHKAAAKTVDMARRSGSGSGASLGDAARGGTTLAVKDLALDTQPWPAYPLQNPERVSRLLRLFSSPRKRLGLEPDELLIFLAIGYLCTRVSHGVVQITPTSLVNVSALLGIPKETVRRKTARLAQRDYVSCTVKGVLIKEIKLWCEMLERVLA